jgi:hypothetical protein
MCVSPQAYASSARAERHVHAHSRAAVDNSVRCNHLLSDDVDQQQRRVALRAVATEPDGAVEAIAFGATALADEALTAARAFVDGLRHDGSALLELSSQLVEIGERGLMTKAKSELLMGSRAIACAR